MNRARPVGTRRSRAVVLAGGSGFLGQALAAALVAQGNRAIVLTRSSTSSSGQDGVTFVSWDGKTQGAWSEAVDGARAVVNLSGRSVNCRYTTENRREIVESRVDSVRAIAEAIRRARVPPEVLVQSGSLAI